MIDETLEAIRGSIKKWSLIVHLNGEDKGCDNCPLCYLFDDSYGCQGCPVYAYTGNNYCESTPYQAWHDHHEAKHATTNHDIYYHDYRIHCPECRRLAQEELMFLQSVLERYKEEEK